MHLLLIQYSVCSYVNDLKKLVLECAQYLGFVAGDPDERSDVIGDNINI